MGGAHAHVLGFLIINELRDEKYSNLYKWNLNKIITFGSPNVFYED